APFLYTTYFLIYCPATIDITTISLHDALPICLSNHRRRPRPTLPRPSARGRSDLGLGWGPGSDVRRRNAHRHQRRLHLPPPRLRSEEHTSELQSRAKLVCRLLLEKKNSTIYRA